MKTLIILLLTAATAMAAHPTGTVTRALTVTTNGVLWGSDTNFASLNGIATTGYVSGVVGGYLPSGTVFVASEVDPVWAAASNTVVYTNDGRLTDNRTDSAAVHTNDAAYQNLLTNTATTAQGAKADVALPTAGLTDGTITLLKLYNTNGMSVSADSGSILSGLMGPSGLMEVLSTSAYGSIQAGTSAYGPMQIGVGGSETAPGSMQRGRVVCGAMVIGDSVDTFGSLQLGSVYGASPANRNSTATNNGTGAVQLFDLTAGQSALTTANGDGSILMGAGVASNRYAIVAGDGQASHGDGSITAGGGFYGSGSGIIGITASQVGAMPSNGVLSSVNWIDLIAPGMTLAGGAQAPQLTAIGTGIGISGMGYDQNDIAYGCLQMPHNLALTNATRSTLYVVPHVHWTFATAPTTNTNVTWELIWEWGNINGGYALHGTNIVTVGHPTNNVSYLTSFGNVTNDGANISGLFRFRLGRTISGADDYGATRIILDQFDIHVPVDRIGSSQETAQ